MFLLLVASFLFGALRGSRGDPTDCIDPLNVCHINMEVMKELPFEKDSLDRFCENLGHYYECFDANRNMFPNNVLCEFPKMLAKSETWFKTRFCSHYQFQELYLKHAQCLKLVREQYWRCDRYAQDTSEPFEHFKTFQNYDAHPLYDSQSCMQASLRSTCLHDKTKAFCGAEAAQLFVELFEGTQIYSHFCPEPFYSMAVGRRQMVHDFLKKFEQLVGELRQGKHGVEL